MLEIVSGSLGVVRCMFKAFGSLTCSSDRSNSSSLLAVSGPLLLHPPSVKLTNCKQEALSCFGQAAGGSSPVIHLLRPDLRLQTCKFHPPAHCKWTALASSSICDPNERATACDTMFRAGCWWFVASYPYFAAGPAAPNLQILPTISL